MNRYQRVFPGEAAWLCPACLQPSARGPKVPDEEDRLCDCAEPLERFVRQPDEPALNDGGGFQGSEDHVTGHGSRWYGP